MSRVVEHMDFVHDGENLIAKQEDRLSNLPDDIIHHILGFLDMKHAIQTSKLSRKWRHIWTSIAHLNLNRQLFDTKLQFAKFVKHALSHRNIHINVSAAELTFTGTATEAVKSIVNYAYSHNVTEMKIIWIANSFFKFPTCLSSSHTLKHLTLAVNNPYFVPEPAWDFPALETLSLTHVRFASSGSDKNLNLFTNCPKLKDLTLHKSFFYDLKICNICAPQLSNLTITNTSDFPEVFNVIAPQLQNLRASIYTEYGFPSSCVLHFSTESFSFLERVNLSWCTTLNFSKKESCVPKLFDLFQKLHSAKFLILDLNIIEILSSSLDQLSREPCPFNNLKSVEIDTVLIEKEGRISIQDRLASIPIQVKDYFLAKSPSATFIMDYPQVPRKRSREQVIDDAMAKKMAKLEAEYKCKMMLYKSKRHNYK